MLTYLFGLAPGLLYGILPDIVRGYRLVYQRSITPEEIKLAHTTLCEAVEEFEVLYYQRKSSRLHFCRQSLHQLVHRAPEIIRLGPGAYYTQWTMERTIGNLGEEIKQHSNPYANLAQRACRRAQVNGLKSLIPDLEPDEQLPRTAEDLGDGYVLLGAKDEYNQFIRGVQGEAIQACLEELTGNPSPPNSYPSLQRYARLRLPNGQILRSAWKEEQRVLQHIRMARNARFTDDEDNEAYAEIQFFFQVDLDGEVLTLALIHLYYPPDMDLLEASSNTLWVCDGPEPASPQVIDVRVISS
ncbi:hypothetical protein C8J57DRAFT_1330006, partial [Mycena rebaudengoi]